jgi:hypothetical protein
VHLLHALLVFDKILQQMLLKMACDYWPGSLEPKPQIREQPQLRTHGPVSIASIPQRCGEHPKMEL